MTYCYNFHDKLHNLLHCTRKNHTWRIIVREILLKSPQPFTYSRKYEMIFSSQV